MEVSAKTMRSSTEKRGEFVGENDVEYAMKMLQKGMEGQASMVGLDTEEAINDLVAEVRKEGTTSADELETELLE